MTAIITEVTRIAKIYNPNLPQESPSAKAHELQAMGLQALPTRDKKVTAVEKREALPG
jgi:hypothetical protein